jgi:hypothetical protein
MLWFLQRKLIFVTQRKHERLVGAVCFILTIFTAPCQGSETSDFFVELSPDDCKSVTNLVALLVELLDAKSMIAGSVQQLYLFD